MIELTLSTIADFYNFRIVAQYAGEFQKGIANTLVAAIASLVLSIGLGTLLALVRLSRSTAVTLPAQIYIQAIRATPLLIQIYIVYYGLPLIIPAAARWPEIWLGIIALTVHSTPYMSEIIRSGILSVDKGQVEGAIAVGMNQRQQLQHVLLPQAFANTIPALVGQTAILVKDTSLLSLITVFDLVSAGMLLNSERIRPSEGFLTVAVVYMSIYVALLFLSGHIQRRLGGRVWNQRSG